MNPHVKQSVSCGIDFGTSNSTLAHMSAAGASLVPLEGHHTALPSAVFFGHEQEDSFLIGNAAVAAYVDGASGRLMRALKSVLGHALINEQTPVFRRKLSFAQIIGEYLQEIKTRAEAKLQSSLTSVVLGRPVQFVENDVGANAAAQASLEAIAKAIGFKHVSFQFEPVAAAFAFERELPSEKLALIADIGGGTSDFSAIRLGPGRERKDRQGDVLSNAGLRLGGTDFDRSLSMSDFMPAFGLGSRQGPQKLQMPVAPYWDLSTWSAIHNLYEPKFLTLLKALRYDAQNPRLLDRFLFLVQERRCHSLLMEVEKAKIALSDNATAAADLAWIEKGLQVKSSRVDFESNARPQAEKLQQAVLHCLSDAGLTQAQVDVVFFTGGGSMVPWVRKAILAAVPEASVVVGDQFGAVGLGLGIEAFHRYG